MNAPSSYILGHFVFIISIYKRMTILLSHQSSSDVALVSGSEFPQPGNISLGHDRVFFE